MHLCKPNLNIAMRIKLLTYFLLLIGFSQGQAQSTDTIFSKISADDAMVCYQINDDKGVIRETGYLLDGVKEGSCSEFNQRGSLVKICGYHKGKYEGTVVTLIEGGFVESEEHYIGGLLNGRRIVYRYGGVKKLVEEYKGGALDGTKILFYDNGFKQEESAYKNGMRNGLTKWFNQSEVVTIEQTYRNGLLEGKAVSYHFNGKVFSEGNYVNNKEVGEWKEYDEEGKHIKSTWYKAGVVDKKINY